MMPMQVRYVRMLEMNEQEVEEAVERELDDNPALSKADETLAVVPYMPRERFPERADITMFDADDSETLTEHLASQIGELSIPEDVRRTALYILGNLDSNGYLQRSEQAMIDDLAFGPGIETTPQTMHQAVELVRSLDPPGVGAVNLQDTLILQLNRLPQDPVRDDALLILKQEFEEFSMKHTHRLVSKLKLPLRRVEKALELIRTLNPKPGSSVGTGRADMAAPVVPDFQVDVERDGDITISFSSNIPALAIEESFEQAYKRILLRKQASEDADSKFILSRYRDARDFINILQQRRDTLHAVVTAIVRLQEQYFRTCDEADLKPMRLKNIADMIGLDPSTVSRATAAKYIATPCGVKPLKYFFSEGYGEGEDEKYSARSVQAALKQIVDSEDKRHPLSDEAICQMLADKGYEVSRRTVAKYRSRFGIPVARLRKG